MAVTEIPFEELRTLLLAFYEAQIAVQTAPRDDWPAWWVETDGGRILDERDPSYAAYHEQLEGIIRRIDAAGGELTAAVPSGIGLIRVRRRDDGFSILFPSGLVRTVSAEAEMEALRHA